MRTLEEQFLASETGDAHPELPGSFDSAARQRKIQSASPQYSRQEAMFNIREKAPFDDRLSRAKR